MNLIHVLHAGSQLSTHQKAACNADKRGVTTEETKPLEIITTKTPDTIPLAAMLLQPGKPTLISYSCWNGKKG